MMTDEPELVLMTFFADCVPLLIADPRRRAIAAVHSGWRGTVEGIGEKAVRKMAERYGSDPSDLVAAIGPSICQDCYEVSGDVICRFQERYPEELWPELYREGRIAEDGERRYQLNLQRACAENFLRAGMLPENISLPDLCTCCNPQLLFSHRASGGKRGNLAAVLMLR
jgi:YfiH family protein